MSADPPPAAGGPDLAPVPMPQPTTVVPALHAHVDGTKSVVDSEPTSPSESVRSAPSAPPVMVHPMTKFMRQASAGDLDCYGEFVEVGPEKRYMRWAHELGSGSFKIVFRAWDHVEGKLVAWNAINLLKIAPDDRKRIREETRILQTLHSPFLIDIHKTWDTETCVVFITDIVESGDLQQFYLKHTVKLKVIKRWATDIMQGLAYLHSQTPPLIHRDIKCSNVLYDAATGNIVIGDLGLAVRQGSDEVGASAGTPNYMAPEMFDDNYGTGVDIYSFGMCVLEMVTKSLPYSECTNPGQIFLKVTRQTPPEALDRVIIPSLKAFITDCITLSADGRRPTAVEILAHPFLQDLDAPDNDLDVLAEPSEEDDGASVGCLAVGPDGAIVDISPGGSPAARKLLAPSPEPLDPDPFAPPSVPPFGNDFTNEDVNIDGSAPPSLTDTGDVETELFESASTPEEPSPQPAPACVAVGDATPSPTSLSLALVVRHNSTAHCTSFEFDPEAETAAEAAASLVSHLATQQAFLVDDTVAPMLAAFISTMTFGTDVSVRVGAVERLGWTSAVLGPKDATMPHQGQERSGSALGRQASVPDLATPMLVNLANAASPQVASTMSPTTISLPSDSPVFGSYITSPMLASSAPMVVPSMALDGTTPPKPPVVEPPAAAAAADAKSSNLVVVGSHIKSPLPVSSAPSVVPALPLEGAKPSVAAAPATAPAPSPAPSTEASKPMGTPPKSRQSPAKDVQSPSLPTYVKPKVATSPVVDANGTPPSTSPPFNKSPPPPNKVADAGRRAMSSYASPIDTTRPLPLERPPEARLPSVPVDPTQTLPSQKSVVARSKSDSGSSTLGVMAKRTMRPSESQPTLGTAAHPAPRRSHLQRTSLPVPLGPDGSLSPSSVVSTPVADAPAAASTVATGRLSAQPTSSFPQTVAAASPVSTDETSQLEVVMAQLEAMRANKTKEAQEARATGVAAVAAVHHDKSPPHTVSPPTTDAATAAASFDPFTSAPAPMAAPPMPAAMPPAMPRPGMPAGRAGMGLGLHPMAYGGMQGMYAPMVPATPDTAPGTTPAFGFGSSPAMVAPTTPAGGFPPAYGAQWPQRPGSATPRWVPMRGGGPPFNAGM